jgi:hypothetical protein
VKVAISYKFYLFLVVLLLACKLPNKAEAEEILWCSGARASSPVCVEFSQALEARSRAEGLKNSLNPVAQEPWAEKEFVEALQKYEKARQLFGDEYFGASAIEFNQLIAMLIEIEKTFIEKLEETRIIVNEAGTKRNFEEAMQAAHRLEQWGETGLSQKKAEIVRWQQDRTLVGEAEQLLERGDFIDAKNIIASISATGASVYTEEIGDIKNKISLLVTDANLSKTVSLGFKELDSGNLDAAKRNFLNAQKLDQNSSVVKEALKEIISREKVIRIGGLKKDLATSLIDENFLNAKDAIDALSQEDPTFFAGNSSAIFTRNIRVEEELDLLLSQLKSLSSVRIRKRIETIFLEIGDIETQNFGARISEKYKMLEKRYHKLSQKVQFELISDGVSSVIIRPGRPLGKFKNTVLNVYPGTYTVITRCMGRKEIVRKIEISPGDTRHSLDLGCKK